MLDTVEMSITTRLQTATTEQNEQTRRKKKQRNIAPISKQIETPISLGQAISNNSFKLMTSIQNYCTIKTNSFVHSNLLLLFYARIQFSLSLTKRLFWKYTAWPCSFMDILTIDNRFVTYFITETNHMERNCSTVPPLIDSWFGEKYQFAKTIASAMTANRRQSGWRYGASARPNQKKKKKKHMVLSAVNYGRHSEITRIESLTSIKTM